MPALAHSSRAIARTWTAHKLPVAASCAAAQSRSISEVHAPSSFDSPFKGVGGNTPKVPSFAAYRNKSKGEAGPKVFQYFMVGTMGALASLGAKATVQGRSRIPPESFGKGGNWKMELEEVVEEQLAHSRMDWVYYKMT